MYFSPSADKKIREGLIKTMSEDGSVDSNQQVAEILLNKSIVQGDLGKLEIRGNCNGTRGKQLRFKKKIKRTATRRRRKKMTATNQKMNQSNVRSPT